MCVIFVYIVHFIHNYSNPLEIPTEYILFHRYSTSGKILRTGQKKRIAKLSTVAPATEVLCLPAQFHGQNDKKCLMNYTRDVHFIIYIWIKMSVHKYTWHCREINPPALKYPTAKYVGENDIGSHILASIFLLLSSSLD